MRWYTVERLSPRQSLTPEGYLVVTDTIIARCGDQVYHHNEVPLDPDDDGFVHVSRDASEVFRPEAITSFEGKAIVDDHPPVEVTPHNHRQYAIGHVQNVRRGKGADADCLVADLVFTDPAAIEKVRGKQKLALSCGYDAYYEHVARGRGAQKKIVGNHVALVDEGRCGARCSIGDTGALIYSYQAITDTEARLADDARHRAHDAGCGCAACEASQGPPEAPERDPAKDTAAPALTPPSAAPRRRRGKRLHLWADGKLLWRGWGRVRDLFDPNEPRNPVGEWTTGGGAAPAPAKAKLPTSGEIDLGATTGIVNPSRTDLAKMLQGQTHKELRGLFEGSRLIVWPAAEALHQDIQRALKMSDGAHRYIISAREGRFDDTYPHQIGRFAARVERDGDVTPPKFMPTPLRQALAVRGDAAWINWSDWADYDPSEPRKPSGPGGGEWTSGGGGGTGTGRAAAKRPRSVAFVSPSVAEHLDFPQAISGLASNRQRILHKASAEIDSGLGIKSHDSPAIGAWSDGAENSIMTEVDGATSFDQLRVAAAMKAHIAEQKAALIFQQDPEGKAFLVSFPATGSLDSIHKNLLADGVEFHTVIPTKDGATVYVADLDGSAHDAIDHAAKRYGATPEFHTGHAEFIPPDTKSDGSDAEQRSYSQQGYERIIAGSGVEGSAALWQRIHHAYGASLHQVKDAYDPNEPRVPKGGEGGGEWTSGGGGGVSGKPSDKPSETFKKGEAVTSTPINGKQLVSWGGDDLPKGNAGWDTLAANDAKDKPFDEPSLPPLTGGKHQGAGVIIREPDGRIWLVHPTNQYGGYKATFPKGTVEPGMTLRGTALKEAYEESGLGVRLTGYAGDIERDTSISRYYYAERMTGSPADAGWESEAVTLAHPDDLKGFLNKKVDHDIVDLIIGKKPSLEAKLAATQAEAAKPIDISNWKQIGHQLGSNPGGQYEDPSGKKFYVKISKSEDHAKNELLAARLYEAAGSPILPAEPVTINGKLGTATPWQDVKLINKDNTQHRIGAQQHFATHAWLANWDAAGLVYDNQGIVNGKMTTLDPGGSLLFRAQGGPKGSAFGDKVGEWDTLRHGSNEQSAYLYGDMTGKQLRESALRVAKVPDKTIHDLTMQHGPGNDAEREVLAARIIARKRDIIKRVMQTGDRRNVLIHWDLAA